MKRADSKEPALFFMEKSYKNRPSGVPRSGRVQNTEPCVGWLVLALSIPRYIRILKEVDACVLLLYLVL